MRFEFFDAQFDESVDDLFGRPRRKRLVVSPSDGKISAQFPHVFHVFDVVARGVKIRGFSHVLDEVSVSGYIVGDGRRGTVVFVEVTDENKESKLINVSETPRIGDTNNGSATY